VREYSRRRRPPPRQRSANCSMRSGTSCVSVCPRKASGSSNHHRGNGQSSPKAIQGTGSRIGGTSRQRDDPRMGRRQCAGRTAEITKTLGADRKASSREELYEVLYPGAAQHQITFTFVFDAFGDAGRAGAHRDRSPARSSVARCSKPRPEHEIPREHCMPSPVVAATNPDSTTGRIRPRLVSYGWSVDRLPAVGVSWWFSSSCPQKSPARTKALEQRNAKIRTVERPLSLEKLSSPCLTRNDALAGARRAGGLGGRLARRHQGPLTGWRRRQQTLRRPFPRLNKALDSEKRFRRLFVSGRWRRSR